MSETVLIVDDRRDILELNRILLESEGYQAVGYSYQDATVEVVRDAAPRVVLLDLVPGDEAPWALLQRLRREQATRDVGVVVTSDSPPLVERALCDSALGVAAGLVMPFDIEALFAAIARAARSGGTSTEPNAVIETLQRAAGTIRSGRRRIIFRWVQRISTLDSFRARPDLTLTEVQGRGDELIDSVADALSLGASDDAAPATSAMAPAAARQHAALRRKQGIGGTDMAREAAALRQELWREVCDELNADPPALEDIWALLARLHQAFDEMTFTMLDAYAGRAAP